MKKRLTLLSLLLLFTMTAMAQTLVDGIYYNLNGSDNTAEVTSGTKYSGDIVIPASISVDGVDYSVTSIGDYAFSLSSGLTSIEIPNSVTSIEEGAFWGCSDLTSIEIPNSVTSIEEGAFQSCSSLTSIEIPNSVTSIADHAFSGCSGLTSIVVEEGNSYYDSRENCNALIETSSNTLLAGCQNTVIPNSVTEIGDQAFMECRGLTSIDIPNSVTLIGNQAFYKCSGLTSIEIPNSVTLIGNQAFKECRGLTSIEIPNSVATIGDYAFYECLGLTRIKISTSVTSSSTSVTSIGSYAFSGCSGLTSIEIPNSVEIGNYAFSGCSNLTSIEIPNSVEIGSHAFSGCSSLTSIEIPNSVTSIADHAFSGCSGLTSIEIPNSVTEIGPYVFSYCSGLTSIEIPNSVTSIADHAFSGCSGLTSIEIPNSVTSIGSSAFRSCTGLTSIEIPNSVTLIGTWAFQGCSSLTSIEIPNSLTSIADYAFCNCSGLTCIEIPNSITVIGEGAFTECRGLTSIEIPNSVTEIGPYVFSYCSGLTSIEIPNSVTSIVHYAFWNCSSLTSIEIPNSVTYISDYAFWNCSSLTSIEIPNSVTLIGSGAFYDCSALTSIEIPNSVTSIGNDAFDGCDGLTSVMIPGSVKSMGDEVFQECSNLSSVSMQGITPPTVGENLFLGCSKLDSIYVPIGASEAYNVAPWNAYNIVELTPNYEPRHNGTKTNNDRDVIAVKLTGESSGEQVYTLTSAEQNKDYTDVTDSVVFKVLPGEELTPKVEQLSDWMHHAVYIDKDKNGFTGAIAAGSEWKPAGDLVSYSYYNNDAADDDKGWNSVGDVLDWSMVVYPPLPAFTAPTEPGIYRMRFVQDWCSIDPAGDADGKFGDFKENGGQIVDVMLEVLNHVYLTDGEAYTNATEKETERIFYTREFKNTQWQSWYVPFDMDYNDVSDEYTVACLNDIHEYDDDEDGVLDRWTMEVLILRPGETIYANLPYVIRAKAVGEKQFVVENTMLYPADEQSMDCSSMRMHYTFTGTYSPIEAQVLRDNGWLAMGNGRLVTPTTTSTLKANRWYLESTPRKGYGSTYQAPKRIELVVIDENGEVTSVEELPLTADENAVWPADVYDLNGRLVKAQTKNLNELPKGVYIVRGEKIVK